MPIVVNSNASAISASYNLSRSNDALRASLEKLSSGKKINRSSDAAGGMAVSHKLESNNRAKRIMDDPASKYSAVTEKIANASAEQKRDPYATHNLERNHTNTSATYGRIVDTDNAHGKSWSNGLTHDGAAMTSQANQLTNIALQLIGYMKAVMDNKELIGSNMNAFHRIPPPLSSEEFTTNSHPKLIVATAGMPNTQNT